MAKVIKKGAGRPVTEWSTEKVSLLKKHYPAKDNTEAATILGVTVRALRSAAMYYKVKKTGRYWDKPETDYILKNWDALSPEEIAAGLATKFKIKKTRWAVINKYRELKGLR